jgi:hypothetical protein
MRNRKLATKVGFMFLKALKVDTKNPFDKVKFKTGKDGVCEINLELDPQSFEIWVDASNLVRDFVNIWDEELNFGFHITTDLEKATLIIEPR